MGRSDGEDSTPVSVRRRAAMVAADIAGRGVRDPRVLEVMGDVPREAFVPAGLADQAYEDRPLPIGDGQTISQPFIVALMTEALGLTGTERVLEIGTGSGYQAAVLARLAGEVVTIERHRRLAERARDALDRLGVGNVEVIVGDGTLGHPGRGPYDAIIVTAGGPEVPAALVEQLADGGRLVMPVGSGRSGQQLVVVTRRGDELVTDSLGAVRFVPLVGEQGWAR